MNGGDSDPWARLPDLRGKSKQAVNKKTIERSSSRKYCEQCLLSGIRSPIQLFQINDDEAFLMCKNVECTYMPSANWETFVVKRPFSQTTKAFSRKNRPSSVTSASSSFSRHKGSIVSAPQRLQLSKGGQSRSSTPCLRNQAGTDSEIRSSTDYSRGRPLSSPTPSVDSSVSEEPERKTLVPIAPFLCRHAQSFASFESKQLKARDQQEEFTLRRETSTLLDLNCEQARGLKRRGSSLDSEQSDSLSSCSGSLDSRPTSPLEISLHTAGLKTQPKPLKRVILSSEALSRLREGSCKLRLIKDSEGRTTQAKLVTALPYHPQRSITSEDQELISSAEKRTGIVLNTPGIETSLNLGGLELKPIETHQLLLPNGALNGIGSENSADIQPHIDAINRHLAAISEAVGGIDFPQPTELTGSLPVIDTELPTNSTLGLLPPYATSVVKLEGELNSTTENNLHNKTTPECSGFDEFTDNFSA